MLFLPCLRAKLVANLKYLTNHSLYESDFITINNNNNNMRSLSRSTIYRKVRNFGSSNSYTKLRNRNRGDDDDDDDDDNYESKEQRSDGTTSNNIKKDGSTNIVPSSSSRMSNAIMRRVRKRKRRFRGISYYAKLKWMSPTWILQRLKSIYGSFFFVDGASSASTPMLMMGLHLSIPQHLGLHSSIPQHFPTSLHAIL